MLLLVSNKGRLGRKILIAKIAVMDFNPEMGVVVVLEISLRGELLWTQRTAES